MRESQIAFILLGYLEPSPIPGIPYLPVSRLRPFLYHKFQFVKMKYIRFTILPVLAATLWISLSEFFRNQYLLQGAWVSHYKTMGLDFPSKPINGAIWGVWSFLFAVILFILSKKYALMHTTLLSWVIVFVLMWLVIGNLGVLPYSILIYAIPLSLLECFVATWIIKKLSS